MNRPVAETLLHDRLARYRRLSYEALCQRVGIIETDEIEAPGGDRFQFEVQFVWDDRPNGDVRVLGRIDDGGWRSFVPLTESFIKAPSGDFVEE